MLACAPVTVPVEGMKCSQLKLSHKENQNALRRVFSESDVSLNQSRFLVSRIRSVQRFVQGLPRSVVRRSENVPLKFLGVCVRLEGLTWLAVIQVEIVLFISHGHVDRFNVIGFEGIGFW